MFRLVAMFLASLLIVSDCVSVGFLVGRCDAVHDQLVVRGFVHFVEVGCFVGRYKCFRRIVDFPDIML